MPIIYPQLTSSDIWNSVKSAYEFLKIVISHKRDGKEYKISAPDNNGIIVLSNQGEPNVTINQNIFNIAERSLDGYRKISGQIQEGRIESISMLDIKKKGIIISSNEKKLFNPETKVEENPINIKGNIFDFNTEKFTGKIRVIEGELIPAKDYNFALVGKQDYIPYIMAMTMPLVTMRCLIEIEQNPTGVKYIYRLQAISLNLKS